MANKLKDPVLMAHFGGVERPIRWDYNTVAELQDLGYDFTDDEFVKRLVGEKDASGNVTRQPEKPSLKMLRAFACAALISGAEDGAVFTPALVGRTVTADGKSSDLFEKVSALMTLAHGEDEPEVPLAEGEPLSA